MVSGSLVVFMKWPEPGQVKTRLAREIGSEAAARLYDWLLRRTITVAWNAAQSLGLQPVAAISPPERGESFARLLGPGWTLYEQRGETLGDRLAALVEVAVRAIGSPVIVIGSDCPWLTENHIAASLEAMSTADLVLGPAEDGGYYLIALNDSRPEIFRGIPWSSAEVLAATLETARVLGLRTAQLEPLSDVDTVSDLERVVRQFPDCPLRWPT